MNKPIVPLHTARQSPISLLDMYIRVEAKAVHDLLKQLRENDNGILLLLLLKFLCLAHRRLPERFSSYVEAEAAHYRHRHRPTRAPP